MGTGMNDEGSATLDGSSFVSLVKSTICSVGRIDESGVTFFCGFEIGLGARVGTPEELGADIALEMRLNLELIVPKASEKLLVKNDFQFLRQLSRILIVG